MEKFERLLDKGKVPSDKDIRKSIGSNVFKVFTKLTDYLNGAYGIEPVLIFGGKNYGWCSKYRKGGRTLCTLFPEKDAFTILITLGKKDLEKLEPNFKKLLPSTQEMIKNAHQYHDGKWLWIRILKEDILEDLKILLSLKRKPKI